MAEIKKSRRFTQAVCFLLSVRFYIVSKPTITPPALGIVAAKTTAGTDLNVCFRKVPAQRSGERPSRLWIFGVVNAHLAAVVVSFQKLLYHRRARLFFAAAFFNGLDRALKTCGGEDVNAENADGARGRFC